MDLLFCRTCSPRDPRFLKQYTILKDHHLENIDSHHKAAFECLCREGQIREDDLVEALLHGHSESKHTCC